MEYTIKIPITATEETYRILDSQSKILNWCYNHLLGIANELKKSYIETQNASIASTLYTKRGLRNLLPELKQTHPFLKTVHSSPLKNMALRLSSSIQDYQKSRKGKRKGSATGWPVFRSFNKKFFSLDYDEPSKGFRLQGNTLELSLGVNADAKRLKVNVNLERDFSDFDGVELRNLKIVKNGNQYSACFGVRRKLPKKKKINKIVSIDPNHKNLGHFVSSAGDSVTIKNLYSLKIMDKRIDQLKSKRDRCKKKSKKIKLDNKIKYIPSKRWKFFDNKLKELYRIRQDQTKTYLHTIANKLYKNYDLVTIGDYTPRGGGINKGMRRSMNNQSLRGKFKDCLSWVAEKTGKHFDIWSERGTTKSCSTPECNYVHKNGLNPNIRWWKCPKCSIVHHRDENASINGLNKIINKLPCFGHLEPVDSGNRCVWKFSGLEVLETKLRGPETLEVYLTGQNCQKIKRVE